MRLMVQEPSGHQLKELESITRMRLSSSKINLETLLPQVNQMPDPDALWKDIQKLDDLYEELLWHPDDELQFSHDGQKIIITNKTLEQKQ